MGATPASGPNPTPREASLDPLHEDAVEAACDLDRAYFVEHPDEDHYMRPAREHELCPAFVECVPHAGLVISVTRLGNGIRARMPLAAGARA